MLYQPKSSPLPPFPVSLTLLSGPPRLKVSTHTPHVYKLLVYYVIWKDNTLSDRDMVFEFYSWEVLEPKSCVQVGVHGALETGTNMLLI